MSTANTSVRPRSELEYPFALRPEPGEAVEIAAGVLWVRMRLPFQLNHINLWLLEDDDGWTVVDCGLRDEATTDAWMMLFNGPMRGRPIKRVIVTHLHPDHVGLAGWLARRFSAELWMSRTDYLLCRLLVSDTNKEAPEEGVRFYRAAGIPEDILETYKTRFGEFGHGVYHLPNAYRRLQAGEQIRIGDRVWETVVGRGHAPEHMCLWCRSEHLFISGDQILPRISSNVSVFPTEPDANPLHEWIESCVHLEGLLQNDVLVLPAHNEPFRRAGLRLRELVDMHEAGMEKLLVLCAQPKRAVDCFPALFRSRITSGNYLMAAGESLAHLNCLRARGAVVRTTDAQGVDWYKAV